MTDRVVHLDSDAHVAVQKLLPWYVTGRLDAAENADVETHLGFCAVCRSELESDRVLQAAVRSQDGGLDDADAGWANMLKRLDATAPVRADAPDPGDARRRKASTDRPLPWYHGGGMPSRAWTVPALLSVALALAIAVTLRLPARFDEGYRALAAPADDSGTAVVRFRPDATEAQIRASLNNSGARLADGPTVTNAYIVRVQRDRYAASLDKLRHQPAVTLVEALEGASTR